MIKSDRKDLHGMVW